MSQQPITWYEHHGVRVAVRADLKGKHRDHCLCYRCARFHPEDRDANCRIAALVYAVCNAARVTLPVWECAEFEPAAEGDDSVPQASSQPAEDLSPPPPSPPPLPLASYVVNKTHTDILPYYGVIAPSTGQPVYWQLLLPRHAAIQKYILIAEGPGDSSKAETRVVVDSGPVGDVAELYPDQQSCIAAVYRLYAQWLERSGEEGGEHTLVPLLNWLTTEYDKLVTGYTVRGALDRYYAVYRQGIIAPPLFVWTIVRQQWEADQQALLLLGQIEGYDREERTAHGTRWITKRVAADYAAHTRYRRAAEQAAGRMLWDEAYNASVAAQCFIPVKTERWEAAIRGAWSLCHWDEWVDCDSLLRDPDERPTAQNVDNCDTT